MITRRQIAELRALALEEGDRRREAALEEEMAKKDMAPGGASLCEVCGRVRAGPGTHVLFSTAEVARRCFRNEDGAASFRVNETCYRLGYERLLRERGREGEEGDS